MKLSKCILCFLCCVIGIFTLAQDSAEEIEEVFDLDEMEVVGQATEKPDLVFKGDSPQITYYNPPELPRGEVIVALDFIDRYKEAKIPGPMKWASIISFPWVDGYERQFIGWICLYMWDGRIYGFSPNAKYDREMRFALPISIDRRTNPDELYSLAEKYVEEISPEDFQMIYMDDFSSSSEDSSGIPSDFSDATGGFDDSLTGMDFSSTSFEQIDIPAGRIEGWRPQDKGKKDEDLVSLMYVYEKNPNPDLGVIGEMGPDQLYKEANTFWKRNFNFEFKMKTHPFDTARELLKPRWCLKATLLYEKNVLFFKDVDHKAEVLLFNVGRPIFAYHPRYGVWRTDATIDMIAEGRGSDMITYPGVDKPMRVLLHMWPDQAVAGN